MSLVLSDRRRVILGLGASGALASQLLASHPSKAQTRPAERLHINIVNTAATTTSALQRLLETQGFLDDLNLDVTHLNVSDGSKLIGSLLSGEMDVCMFAGIAQLLPAMEKGARLKIIGGANLRASFAVYTKRPEIKTLADLVGRTVATGSPGALLHHAMVAAFQAANVDYTKVQFVNVGSSADVFRAVVAGAVDAAPSSAEYYNDQKTWGVHSIAELWDLLPNYPFQGSFASDAAIRGKREALVRALAAYGRLYRFIMSPQSRDAYVKAYHDVAGGTPRGGEEQWAFHFKNQAYAVNLTIPDQNLRYLQELNNTLGLQHGFLPTETIADMSLAADALKLLA